jgi:hypothetical protein
MSVNGNHVDVPEWYSLRVIYDTYPQVRNACSYKQLQNWTSKSKNDFPEPKGKLGRYTLYDPAEVVRWVVLWTQHMYHPGNPENMEKGRQDAQRSTGASRD